ncbi:hypothetical protein [Pseudonocardia humida]|uniref:Uncharacterized protein n=1 Tax=Pseudonocardia humida TaxID=2800819 RepID=A0ABT1A441_9PSEU|nr:hypothetical protein [Pseudonocardia humida]
MLSAISAALRLTGDERAHLFRLAGHTPPDGGGEGRHLRRQVARGSHPMASLALLTSNAPGSPAIGRRTSDCGQNRASDCSVGVSLVVSSTAMTSAS